MRQLWRLIWPWARKASDVTTCASGATLSPPITEQEIAVVMEYRVWVAHQQKLAGGGCGGCPSAGGCSEAEADVGDPRL